MLYTLLFFGELFALFLLSTILTKKLSVFFYRVTKSQKWTITLMALLFFPGTVIHELAHFFMAHLLFVPVGQMEFVPKIHGDSVKLGSVAIAKTDIFRRLLIGMAPFLIGTSIVLGILFLAVQYHLFQNILYVILIGYTVFEIGNTMFSSKKDMEGALELLITLVILFGIFYFLGVQLPAFNPELLFGNPVVQEVFQKGALFLAAPISIDLIIILLLRLFIK